MNPLIRAWLDSRHLNAEGWRALEQPSSAPLQHIDDLTGILRQFHADHKRIVILPDFDMDGIAAGTLGFAGLDLLGFNVALYRPDPSRGYGFTGETIDDIFTQFPDTQAVLTCDVGITAYEGISRIHEHAALALVTDHHVQEQPLEADIIVNPNQIGETYEHPSICGAHVLWQVLHRYAQRFEPNALGAISILRVFAGFGTISDQMELTGENRRLVRDACAIMRDIHVTPRQFTTGNDRFDGAVHGLHTILQLLHEHGKFDTVDELDENFIGFYLAPMFNSAKRMNGSMDDVFGIFFEPNRSYELAAGLFNLNEQRKKAVEQYMAELEQTDQPYAPYVFLSQAPLGILGLLATRLINRTQQPVFVLNQDLLQGSGRTPSWYPAIDTLSPLGHHIAGHQHAFGVRSSPDDLALLAADTERTANELGAQATITPREPDISLAFGTRSVGRTILDWDCAMLLDYCAALRSYAPFGPGFEAPLISLEIRPQDMTGIRIMGTHNQHMKISTTRGLEVTLFNQAQLADTLHSRPVTVTGTVEPHFWRGKVSVQMRGTIAPVNSFRA